jgi:hypothetical protein
MLDTLSGMFTEVKAEHPVNALAPMLVTLEGRITDVNPVRPLNALLPTLVNEPSKYERSTAPVGVVLITSAPFAPAE